MNITNKQIRQILLINDSIIEELNNLIIYLLI